MGKARSTSELPTPQQVSDHLTVCELRAPSRMLAALPLLTLFSVFALVFFTNDPLLRLVAAFGLIGLFLFANLRVRRMQQLEQRALRIQETAMLRDYTASLRLAWQSLPTLTTSISLHHQVVACIAQSLDQLHQHDAAVVAYDYLIDRLPEDEPAGVEIRARRAIVHLVTDRLADADDSLRKLRGLRDQIKHTTVGAIYRFAVLLQQVRTNHHKDAVDDSGTLLDELRPLGIDAGFGHGLQAYCYRMMAQRDDEPELKSAYEQRAALWWSRATLLVPAERLIDRFAELSVMSETEETE